MKTEEKWFCKDQYFAIAKVSYGEGKANFNFMLKCDDMPLTGCAVSLSSGPGCSETKITNGAGEVFFSDRPISPGDTYTVTVRMAESDLVLFPITLSPYEKMDGTGGKGESAGGVSERVAALNSAGHFDEAIKLLKETLKGKAKKKHDEPGLYLQLAEAFSLARLPKEAFAAVQTGIRKARALGTPSAMLYHKRAGLYLKRGKLRFALRDIKKSIGLAPGNSSSWALALHLKRRLNDLKGVINTYVAFSRKGRRAAVVDVSFYYVISKMLGRHLAKMLLYGMVDSLITSEGVPGIDALCGQLVDAGLKEEYRMVRRIAAKRFES